MLKECRIVLSWALAAWAVFALPSCLVWQLELHPGTTYLDHLAATIPLLCGALFLLITPSSCTEPNRSLPDEHVDVFRYAIRSGALPIASLFSDWTRPLEQLRNLLKIVLRYLPITTVAALAMDLHGILIDPKGHAFFLVSALAAILFSLAAFSQSAVGLKNIQAVEARLRSQEQRLASNLQQPY
ncbi:hypothetical protein [Arthrobacter sp. OAP107]|uniref:hypothetical protein n=1 Tax=Arthrobacter sp. OAP107 TaxID=3156445 RepID=UPI0033979BDF